MATNDLARLTGHALMRTKIVRLPYVTEFFAVCHWRHDAKGTPSRPMWRSVKPEPRNYAVEADRGDCLRAARQALPVCWLPGDMEWTKA